ncbi:MAG: DNA polymerase III subunit beta [Bacillota bacterium]
MIVRGQKSEINRCLDIVEKALPVRSTIPVTNNILLESTGDSLIFTTTNLELEIKVKIYYEGGEQGKILLPPKVVDIVRHLPSPEVDIKLNWETFRIDLESGAARFNLYGSDPTDYPKVDEINPRAGALLIEPSHLKELLKEVVFAASTDESRPAFNGVLFQFKEKGVELTASDTYRLVVKEVSSEDWSLEEQRYLIPAKSLRELLKILDENNEQISIFPHQDQVVFHLGKVYFATRVLNEKYPNVSGVIPEHYQTRLIVERKTLEETVSRAALLAEGINQVVQFAVSDSHIDVKVSSQLGRMEEAIPVRKEGESIDIYVNSRFILDILKVVEAKEIIIDFHGTNGPIIFRLVDDLCYLYLVLPIKMG